MSYVYLIPSMQEYARKFKQLDSLDFKIIRTMCETSMYNLSTLAHVVNAPQQTVNYRVKRLDSQDLVRFRALINEAKLGLKSYSVIASAPLEKEESSSEALTCFPLWRYLANIDGRKCGSFVRYAIPVDKERDLGAFLSELVKRDVIFDFEITPTTSTRYPFLDLDFYSAKEPVRVFDWQKWINNYDSFEVEKLHEPTSYQKIKFDIFDLIILRCLEMDARITQRKIVSEIGKILKVKNCSKFIPLVSRRVRSKILPQKLISGYRAYLFPNPELTVLAFMFHLVFSNRSSLERFAAALNHLPYNASYEKVLGKDELFVRFILPIYECANIRGALRTLAKNGHLKEVRLFFADLAHGTWYNIEMYQMFKDDSWNFSYGAALESFERAAKFINSFGKCLF